MGRIQNLCRKPRFLSSYFSPDEIRYFAKHRMSPQLIAENYCAKIAFAKAIGTGFRVVRARDITVLRDRLGSPFIITEGNLKKLEQREGYVIHVSVDHSRHYAVANVIINR